MFTWLLYILLAPTNVIEATIWASCGVMADMFVFGQIYQKIEKIIDKHHKSH